MGFRNLLFLTSKINQLTPAQRAVYNYLKDEVASDEYIERLHKKVQDVRQNKEWRREYMTLEMMLDEKLEEGIEQGLEQGLEQGVDCQVKLTHFFI